MSLINDALKRAREANKEHGGSTPPLKPLDPVESAAAPESKTPWILVGITALVALLALFFLYQWSQQPDAGPPLAEVIEPGSSVEAAEMVSESRTVNRDIPQTTPTEFSARSTNPAPALATTASPTTTDSAAFAIDPSPVQPAAPLPDAESLPTGPVSMADSIADAPPPLEPEPETPPKPEFKLQSVIYRLKNPAVLINGKFLELGESINSAVVIDIQRHAATLRRSDTNIDLSLPPI